MFKKLSEKVFLNEKCMVAIIVFNAVLIFLQESGMNYFVINLLDVLCTLVFLGEMIAKHVKLGVKGYWTSGLNVMDGILVLISLPSVATFFFPELFANLSFLLVLRIFRIFRFFRMVSMFKNFTVIAHNFRLAVQQSYAILLIFCIIIVTFALIGCCLFRDYAPAFFATPLDSIYSTFRLFSIEGWYEIPDAVAAGMGSAFGVHVVRLYFCILLLIGGVIGMSLINSIFVDAMVSDNNDDVKEKLDAMDSEIKGLRTLLMEQQKEIMALLEQQPRRPLVVVRDAPVTSPLLEPTKGPENLVQDARADASEPVSGEPVTAEASDNEGEEAAAGEVNRGEGTPDQT